MKTRPAILSMAVILYDQVKQDLVEEESRAYGVPHAGGILCILPFSAA